MVETSELCNACGSYSVPKRARYCPSCGSRVSDNAAGVPDSEAIPMVPAVPVGMSSNSITSGGTSNNSSNDNPLHVSAVSAEPAVRAVTESAVGEPVAESSVTSTTPATSTSRTNTSPSQEGSTVPRRADSTPTATVDVIPTMRCYSAPHAPSVDIEEPTGKPSYQYENDSAPNVNIDTAAAMFWKNPSSVMLERAANYTAMGGILFIGNSCRTHQGKFTLPKTIHCGQILKGNKLDLSRADFIHPVTTILVGTILGGFKLVVPRGVRVETTGFGILGGFQGLSSQNVNAGQVDDAPMVVVQGMAILGGVKVTVNHEVPAVQII